MKFCHVKRAAMFCYRHISGMSRDIYRDLIGMPFDGIGLDFLEGKETMNLIEKIWISTGQAVVCRSGKR